MNERPRRLVLVTGTATEVGKTWMTAVALGLLRHRGLRVSARKPVQSFAPDEHPTDAEVLAAATGESPDAVCPPHRAYERAMAPPMAAAVLGRPAFTVDDLVAELSWPPDVEVGAVESVGGPRSPLAGDGDTIDLAAAVAPDLLVLVADPGLGAINAVRLSAAPFAPRAVVVALNRYDEADAVHAANRRWLEERDRLDIVTSPTGLVDRITAPP